MSAATANLAPRDPVADGKALFFAGDLAGAVAAFRAAAEAEPASYEARYWLYSGLVASGDWERASAAIEEARTLHAVAALRALDADMERFQTDKAYCAELGRRAYASRLMGPATVALGRALDFDNLDHQVFLSYGLSLQHQGRMAEAINAFSAGAEFFPHPSIHEFLLYALFHAPDRMRRVYEEARRWGDLYAAPLTPANQVFANNRSADRRLRIGYVGPSFTKNQVTRFLLPVLEAHDPEAVDVFLYCANPQAEDALPPHCQTRGISTLSDPDLARLIRNDGIDILVDVWGHTAGSRVLAFALRPAPIQIAWINYIQTTGLSCMDYVLHGDAMAVPGTEQYFTEEIWRIGPIMTPYRPAPDRRDPVSTPALRNGYVTFGSFNNPSKLSEMTVAAWATILKARPRDRLVLKYDYFIDPVLQRATQARFAVYGARPEQLEFRGRTAGQEYLREFEDIDLALDPSPCPGGTTTCEAISNGVPVLTQWGEDFYTAIGVTVLLPCGLPELVAESWDDYVARALDLTADYRALDALRAKVRTNFDASGYRDEIGFTRRLEDAFRQMFVRWLSAN